MSAQFQNNNIFIVVPAYNEHSLIREVVKTLLLQNYTIVVVDDGSSPKLLDSLLPMPFFYYVRHKLNLGQGAALQTGIEFALSKGAEFIVTFDADGQHNSKDIPALLWPLENREADLTFGSRFLKPGNHYIPFFRKLIIKTGTVVNFLFTGIYLSDAHNGLRAMTCGAAEKIHIKENRMAHASELLWNIKRLKLRWKEVPVSISYTAYSRNKGQSGLNSIRILFDLFLHKFFE
jgi:polyprenyl-phospho-N-acetylgalactosaminyl synthase